MNLNVYRVFHINGLTFFIATSRAQQFIAVLLIRLFIEKQLETLYGLGKCT